MVRDPRIDPQAGDSERAAVVAWLRRRADEQDAAARAADTEGQRKLKQAQARSTRSAADRIERGEHIQRKPHGDPPEAAPIHTTAVEAVHELWRAWLVAAVTPMAVSEPPQMFRAIDGRWCLCLRPHDSAPRWLGIDAAPEQAEIHEAFRRLHTVINHAKTPILLAL